MNCPNYEVCHKMMKPGLKVCSPCFWRFNNEVLEFNNDNVHIVLKIQHVSSSENVHILFVSNASI